MRLAELGPAVLTPDQMPRFLDIVRQTYPAAHRRQLEGILQPDDSYNTFKSRAFVYAKRVPRGNPVLWPVLAFAADGASRRLKISAALFFEGETDAGRIQPAAVGWRFEPPEDETGEHSYYHVQPISSWDVAGTRTLPIQGKLNDNYPAIPVAARDSLSLLAAVLVSLYGRVDVKQIFNDARVKGDISPVRDKLDPWL